MSGAGTRIGPRIVVVQHEDACPPALFGEWLAAAGAELDVRRAYAGDPLPDLTGADGAHDDGRPERPDGVLILGGSMGADDDSSHDWIGPVKQVVRDAVAAGVPTLGICLGHQLIASALGGSVRANPRGQQLGLIEVGWTPAAATDELVGELAGPSGSPRRGVQWNDDIVQALPAGTELLARTSHGEVQAARFAARVWGVQLHPEADLDVVSRWAASDAGSHQARGVDQAALLAGIDAASDELRASWRPLAERFVEIAGATVR